MLMCSMHISWPGIARAFQAYVTGPSSNRLHNLQCGGGPPHENYPEVAAIILQQSVPIWTCCLMGSWASPATRSNRYKMILSQFTWPTLTRQASILQLCLQGKYVHLCRLGLKIRQCLIYPRSWSCDLVSPWVPLSYPCPLLP